MNTTLNQALEQGEQGNWDAAWELAQQDDGLLAGVSREDWFRFAVNAIRRRAEEHSYTMPAAYYS